MHNKTGKSQNQLPESKPGQTTYSDKEIHELKQFLDQFHWDLNNSDQKLIEVDATHPMRPVIDTITQIKSHLDELSKKQKHAEEVNQVLFSISNAVNTTSNLDELYKSIHQSLSRIIDVTNFWIGFYDKGEDSLTFNYIIDTVDKPERFKKLSNISASNSASHSGFVIRSGKPVLHTKEQFMAELEKKGITPLFTVSAIWLGVPLKIKGEVIAVMAVHSFTNPDLYNEKDAEVMLSVSEQIALAIERKRTEEALRASELHVKNLSLQTEQFSLAAASVIAAKNEQEAFDRISQTITEHSDYRRHIISYFKDTPPYRDIIGHGGMDGEVINRLRKLDARQEYYLNIFEEGVRVGQLSYYLSHTKKHILKQDMAIFGTGPEPENEDAWHPQDMLFVRMNDGKGNLIGVISVDVSKSGKKPTDETVRPLEIFSSLISQILIYKKVQEQLTQAKQAAESAEVQNRQLQKAESLGRMAGAIAHHFNNQLGAVMGNLEIALEDLPPDSPLVENLTESMEAARKAAEISGLMLTYLGQSTGTLAPLDLAETCRQSLPLLQAGASHSLTLKAELPSPGPSIRADTNQIQQILTNLVTNAWEAISENHGEVHLQVKTVSRTDIPAAHRYPVDWQPVDLDYACLEVSDGGCGIAPADIDKLFDPFFSKKFTGRGLGLPVVLGIVKAHNGVATVESEVGRGTTFRVFFPVSVESPPQPTPKAPPSLAEGRCLTVLLVEDDASMRKMTAIMLARLGFNVLTANDGIEALEIFKNHRQNISVVLSDLSMPRMGGWETLTALRRLQPNLPVILASGHDESTVLAGNHPELPQVFLHKPYQKTVLKNAIAKAMGG